MSSAGVNWVFVRMNAKTKGVKAQHDMRGVHRLCRSSPCLPSSLFPSFGREGDGGMVLVDKAKELMRPQFVMITITEAYAYLGQHNALCGPSPS